MQPRIAPHGERGQITILAAFTLVVFLGFLGLVVDVGHLYVVRQQLRNLCDGAAGAGAIYLPHDPVRARQYAMDYYRLNSGLQPTPGPFEDDHLYTIEGTGDRMRIRTPYEDHDRRIYVAAERTVPSLFMQVLGIKSRNVFAYAVGLQKGRKSFASLVAANNSDGRTQPIPYVRPGDPNSERYAVIIEGNNLLIGARPGTDRHETPEVIGAVASAQNVYTDSNNSTGAALYGDHAFPNYGKGNHKTSPELLNPEARGVGGMVFLDPNYYLEKAQTEHTAGSPHVFGSPSSPVTQVFGKDSNPNGFYFVYGDIVIDKQVSGTATFAATGNIYTDHGTKIDLTFADAQNKILFYAGADPTLNPATYFSSAQFNPNQRYIYLEDNSSNYRGTLYSPYGYTRVDSNNTTITGSIVADTIAITKDANWVTINYDIEIAPPLTPSMVMLE